MRSAVENRQVLKMLRIIKWRPFIRRDDGRIKIEKRNMDYSQARIREGLRR